MKLLTIALDGGDRRIIERMPMPFMHEVLRRSQAPRLVGDLYSRGWAEIYTGKHCVESGALYMYPQLDGTYRFTQSYNYKMSEGAGCPMLWNTLNERGYSVGFMNIPTTSPAPAVDGFFVGGGGGGVAKTDGVPDAICDSEKTRSTLEEAGYVPDLRLGGEDIETLTELFDRLDQIIEIRKNAFLRLCDIEEPDFGLLCFRVTTTIQYLAMSEIEVLLAERELSDLGIGSQSSRSELNSAQERILQHYRLLDDMIREVFEKLRPDDYVFCADHGSARYKYNANANSFLMEAGYQVSVPDKLFRAKRFLFRARRKLGGYVSCLSPRQSGPLTSFDPRRTKAFGNWYVPGIYINDKRRFGGPVHDGKELDRLVDEISERFNNHENARRHSLEARAFRREHLGSPWANRLPDILIEKPDEVFFGRTEGFVTPNPNYGPIPERIAGLNDMHSGQKSRHPLFLISDGMKKHIYPGDSLDLRLVYSVISRYFGEH